MRQILVVHSSVDERFESFFTKIFQTVVVQTVWETYENLRKSDAAKDKIQKEILGSDTLFFILSTDGELFTRSKDWFPWATGLAQGKDIWVFEHCEDLKRVPAVIPCLGNYAAYYITNAWSDFILKIAETYEKPKALPAALPAALLVPLSSAQENLSFESATGRALFDDSTSRPRALRAHCPICASVYNLFIPSEMKAIRCPACGHFYGVHTNAPATVSATA